MSASGESHAGPRGANGSDTPRPIDALLAAARELQSEDDLGLRDLLGRVEVAGLDTLETDRLVEALHKSTRFRIRAIRDLIGQMHGGGNRRGDQRRSPGNGDPGSPLLWSSDARERLANECTLAASNIIKCADPLTAAYECARATFGLVGEETTFKATLLQGVSLLLERPLNARISGESGGGKTFVAECVPGVHPGHRDPDLHQRIPARPRL
jgi:hypothetical protein